MACAKGESGGRVLPTMRKKSTAGCFVDWMMAERTDKKRKRASEDDDASNKKAALDRAVPGRIQVVFNGDSKTHPVLASTPGLTAPTIPFKAYAKRRSAKTSYGESPKPDTHDLMLHSSYHPRLDYTATPIALDQNLSHYVAIYPVRDLP